MAAFPHALLPSGRCAAAPSVGTAPSLHAAALPQQQQQHPASSGARRPALRHMRLPPARGSTLNTLGTVDLDALDATATQEEEEEPLAAAAGPVSLAEVQAAAARRGLRLELKRVGPFYRIVLRDARSPEATVLAVSSGFAVPAMGLLHCESLQIFTRGRRGPEGERLRGSPLGLGLLMGAAVFSFGKSQGCRRAEILAIKDDDMQHKRLARYYSYFGFKKVREVGDNGLRDLPDLLVWGGVGQRMDANIDELLARWSKAIRTSRSVPGPVL